MGAPSRRVVLIGASNLIRGIRAAIGTARDVRGGPLDALVATGHGRSFGLRSRVLGRVLPPILECGLWNDLAARPASPTTALVTDVGNDILYGVEVPRIADWVEDCLARLAAVAGRIVVAELPLESVTRLGRTRFEIARTILFPKSRLRLETAIDLSSRLNERIVALARRHGADTVRPRLDWYGFDPVHVRRARIGEAWRAILAPWADGAPPARAASPPSEPPSRRELGGCRPLHRRLFGRAQYHPQPSAVLRDGSSVSFY